MFEPVCLGIAARGYNGVGTLVEHMDVGSAGARSVQAKAAQETEAIQHLRVFGEFGDPLVIELLIEVQAGFVTAEQVCFEP